MGGHNSDQLISYIGKDPFACVVFSRQDEALAVPLCLKLQRAGYLLRFAGEPQDSRDPSPDDDTPGNDTDACRIYLFMLSAHFFDSHVLRQLLNAAFLEKKPVILLFLERFEMMPSLQMQRKAAQTLYYREYDNEEVLLSVLQANPLLQACRQENKTVYYPKDNKYRRYSLIRKASGEKIPVTHSGFRIGRQEDVCDYVIRNNDTVSRVHAVFELDLGLCTVRDNASTNHVYLNDVPLRPDEEKTLKQDDLIELGSEQFTVLVEDLNDE